MGRPNVEIKVNITARKGTAVDNSFVMQDIALIGPGDITGINLDAIIKTEPRNWITNFLPNYFPYIEFYEEDFPWRYSPARASGSKLRPWIALVVLKASEFKRDQAMLGTLPSIQVLPIPGDAPGTTGAESGAFPPASQLWAWAHVHFNGDLDSTDSLDPGNANDVATAMDRFRSLLAGNPDRAYSRIICPRKLDPNTTYHCFLIPAYETGRLAGLGAKEEVIASHEAQKPSFGIPHETDADHLLYKDRFPVYYEWQFMTGVEGDFESLVRKLKPQPVHPSVGTRAMDVQSPGLGVNFGAGPAYNNGVLMLEGCLLPPGGYNSRTAYPWSNAAPSITYRLKLAGLLNLGEDMLEATFPPSSVQPYTTNPYGYTDALPTIQDDPIVTPDLYGRWHALKRKLDATNLALTNNNTWLYESNLDPRSRAVAGIGVKYIKKNQEELMDKAWEQLGEVIEANRKLKWGQLSQQATFFGFGKHLKNQPSEQKTALLERLMKRVRSGSASAYKVLEDSALPAGSYSYAYRKVERPQGPLMRRLDPAGSIFSQNSLRVNLAAKVTQAVPDKVVSNFQARTGLPNLESDVQRITSHHVVTPIFAPTQPGDLDFPKEYESEIRFQAAVERYDSYFESINWPSIPEKAPITLGGLMADVTFALDPRKVISRKVYGAIKLPVGYVPPPADKIVPVMAYPVFNLPTYEALISLGAEFFCPNLDKIPDNSITLLESNQRFIEAYLLGMNHEMGRELLWREFLTDQRGSYFRQFWDSADAINEAGDPEPVFAENLTDIKEIHTWLSNTKLGTHTGRAGLSTPNPLVLVIRGDLLKRFPDTVIYAQKAKFTSSNHNLPRTLDTELKFPLFSARVEPDITFIGFDLTKEVAKGDRGNGDPGWFFVIQERPGEIRFGVDEGGGPGNPATWNDLSEGNAPFQGEYLNAANGAVVATDNSINGKNIPWGVNSTHLAQILYQNPVLLAVHADDMLP